MSDDVCLILEGTYPFVRGGVSSWVHRLIKSLPDIQFSLLTLSPSSLKKEDFKYEIPENVNNFVEIFLQDYDLPVKKKFNSSSRKEFWKLFKKYSDCDLELKSGFFKDIVHALGTDGKRKISPKELLYSRESWNLIKDELQRWEALH